MLKNFVFCLILITILFGGTDDMRGIRKNKNSKTTIERLDETIKRIAETEQLLKELKAERKKLEETKKSEEVEELLTLIHEKGMTIEDAKNCIGRLSNDKIE